MKKHHNPLETKYGPNPDENLQEMDRLNNEAIRKRFVEETPSPIPSVEEAAENVIRTAIDQAMHSACSYGISHRASYFNWEDREQTINDTIGLIKEVVAIDKQSKTAEIIKEVLIRAAKNAKFCGTTNWPHIVNTDYSDLI